MHAEQFVLGRFFITDSILSTPIKFIIAVVE
jgi:hypothetical protein